MKGCVEGLKIFCRYFSYICVWFAFVMALMSFNIQTEGLGWVMYVIGVMYISTHMTIRVVIKAEAYRRTEEKRIRKDERSYRQYR